MSRKAAAAAFGVCLAFSAGTNLGYAQDNTAHRQGTAATNPVGSDMIKSDQMRASKIIGATVYDKDSQKLGAVQDIVLDKDGKVSAVVVAVGSFLGVGGKNVAVKLDDITTDNNRLTLNRSKQQLQQANNYELENKQTGAGTSPSPVHGGQAGTSSGTSVPPPSQRR